MALDRTPGQVNQLTNALNNLGGAIVAQGIGVSEKLDRTSDRLAASVDEASRASNRHANSLVCATWALVGVTVVLAIITAIHLYFTVAH